MSAVQHSDEHRVTALVRGFREELGQVSAVSLWSMPAAEAGDVLVLLTQVRSQLDALQMRVLRHASSVEVGSDAGARSSGTRRSPPLWLVGTSAPTRRGSWSRPSTLSLRMWRTGCPPRRRASC